MGIGRIVVVGQVARDLVLRVDCLPADGASAPVLERIERLGGKGANQAVGLSQLGRDVVLVGVVGDDDAGRMVLTDGRASGLDVEGVTLRGRTALMVDIVGAGGSRRLLEDVPDEALIVAADLDRAAGAIGSASTLSLQLQQPLATLLAAVRLAPPDARVVLDGGAEGSEAEELLARADVLRADSAEAEMWAGTALTSVEVAEAAAGRLLARGPDLVALAVPGRGDLVAWRGGSRFFPHSAAEVVDPTGAGDAFVAGLIAALDEGAGPEEAGALGKAAATSTVGRLGGRPDLSGLGGRTG
ncbi:PfkB family carbohydrate kinase [Naasia sp. SYSU D00057]|uniref:PfkB family carbohydrate kinase n=1 Tax=Naasia sp. SYSU D00057 TaxID=2817380 RepID=UPI001FF02627|nr:PfkB family carbohydrate kinase [Naasia sp. SYSU D00057]